MRQHLIMGNWKLNGTKASVEALVEGLKAPVAAAANVEVAVCAPVIFLGQVEQLTAGSALKYGSQDADVHTSGAFTGENSPVMLKEFGCKYALVGHSERRTLHAETDAVVAAKFVAIQAADLVPVLCIGETLEQFEANQTNAVVEAQLKAVIDVAGIEALAKSVIAYEPVWAIGTGKTATPEIAQAVHAHIRAYLAGFNADVAAKVQVLYGGSMNAANAADLLAQADIDGGLIGGASLKVADFTAIIEAAAK
ncbi:MAG: triose-phosphate isomerase [Gammaproteobacteria bacterium]|uniref:Triosephosphate isomerase n=1 Tax=Tolumonas osonensis TaxID=675874 RepID=A0A841GLJ1_9GAMM|nr:triose-phosphate isomerase [Tolumonas osonensis]MBB6055660.1 triosephosphate isomerase [Tolumonas osonensis]NCB61091.1 triose-phosphate isomerase [Gammaproteobacteria bacterium]